MDWISIQNAEKPENMEEVLVCRMDGREMEDISLCTFMKVGTTYNDEADEWKEIHQSGIQPEAAFLKIVFEKGAKTVKTDGFFCIDTDKNGFCRYREVKHLTHWMRLSAPKQ